MAHGVIDKEYIDDFISSKLLVNQQAVRNNYVDC